MSLKFVPLTLAAGAAAMMFWASPAAAYSWYYWQNFESVYEGKLPAGWTKIEREESKNPNVDVGRIDINGDHNKVLQLRDFIPGTAPTSGFPGDVDALAMSNILAVAGWEHVIFRYDWKGHETDKNDLLYVDLNINDAGWTNVAIHQLKDDGWHTNYIDFDAKGLDDSPTSIQVRFWTDIIDLAEKCTTSWKHGVSTTTCKTPESEKAAKIDNLKIKYDRCEYSDCGPPPGQTVTPIPGALPLFASGFALLGGMIYRRKRRAQKAAA